LPRCCRRVRRRRRPSPWDEFLAAKRSASVAATAGSDLDGGFVDELHDPDLEKKKPRRERQGLSHAFLRERSGALPGHRLDADDAAVLRAFDSELDLPCHQREQRVVAAHADVVAGVKLGAALADDDLARLDALAAEDLHAQSL